jgi:hypothetical protein
MTQSEWNIIIMLGGITLFSPVVTVLDQIDKYQRRRRRAQRKHS